MASSRVSRSSMASMLALISQAMLPIKISSASSRSAVVGVASFGALFMGVPLERWCDVRTALSFGCGRPPIGVGAWFAQSAKETACV